LFWCHPIPFFLTFFFLLFFIHHLITSWFSQDLGWWQNAWYSKQLGVFHNRTLLPPKFLVCFLLDGKFHHFIMFVKLFYRHMVVYECSAFRFGIFCSPSDLLLFALPEDRDTASLWKNKIYIFDFEACVPR
jgi:hypothetical protein